MSSFSNSILGGVGKLIRQFIRSPDYVVGSTGWTINKDGTAEFNNVTMRGTLILHNNSTGSEIDLTPNGPGGFSTISFIPDNSRNWDAGSITSGAYGANGGGALGITAPRDTTWLARADSTVSLHSSTTSTADNSDVTLLAHIAVIAQSPDGLFPWVEVEAGNVHYHPSAGGRETWHTLSLQNGWTNRGAGYVPAQYRLSAAPANSVQLAAQIVPGTKTDGTTLFQLPVGYRPTKEVAVVVAGGTQAAAQISIGSDGVVKCWAAGAVSLLQINTLIPLDIV